MPIYEYECKKCLNRFEILVLSKAQGKINCPECGSDEINKLFSAFASKSENSISNCGSKGFS